MKVIIIVTIFAILSSCKVETNEQKSKRLEKEACELAYRYLAECAYEHKRVRLAPLSFCDQKYADKVLSYPCETLIKGLK